LQTTASNKKAVTILIHVIAWLLFFLTPLFFIPPGVSLSKEISTRFYTSFLITHSFLLVFYYLNTLVLIPKLLFPKKWWWFAIAIIICSFVFTVIPREINNKLFPRPSLTFRFEKRDSGNVKNLSPITIDSIVKGFNGNKTGTIQSIRIDTRNGRGGSSFNRFIIFSGGNFILFLLVFAIGTGIAVTQQWLSTEAKHKATQNEQLQTELSFLKSQINPHFFFNTLNNIYALAAVNSPNTAPSILKLSAIMRHLISDSQQEKVELEKEIQFIKNYIDLQLVRLTDKVDVQFTITGQENNHSIAPLLFIAFVENCFKYGVSTKENSFIHIAINSTANAIQFTAHNRIVNSHNTIAVTTGIGLNNVKRRLNLLYHEAHYLQIDEKNNEFLVTLNITTA
jgi:two-component system, LytTR family, sensor kinase